jgi:hypothetical protein
VRSEDIIVNSARFTKFGIMQVQVDIAFDQLLKVVRKLPAIQLKQLKAEIEKGDKSEKSKIDLEALLLNGPTATKKQLAIIEINRKSINQWRTK